MSGAIGVVVISVIASLIYLAVKGPDLMRDARIRSFNAVVEEVLVLPECSKPSTHREIRGKVVPVVTNLVLHKVLSGPTYGHGIVAKQIDRYLFYLLPRHLRATRPDEVGTIVLLNYSQKVVGRYSGGLPAIRTDCSIQVIDWKERAVVYQTTFEGELPSSSVEITKTYHDSGHITQSLENYGGAPTRAIAKYLASLPHEAEASV